MTKADQNRFLDMDDAEREQLKRQNPELFRQLSAWENPASSNDDLAQVADRRDALRDRECNHLCVNGIIHRT